MRLAEMPHVLQFNKRDLPRLSPIEDLNAAINKYNAPFYESVAVTGIGVQDTLKAIVKLVLLHLTRKYDPKAAPATTGASVAVPAMPPAVAAPAPPPPIAVPVSRVDAPMAAPAARVVPPPPDFRAPAVAATAVEEEPALGRFDEEEIDGIMAEVEDACDVPAEPVRAAAPEAPAVDDLVAPPAPPEEDEGVWLGAPEEEASPFAAPDAAFGSTLSFDELADAVEARQSPAPAAPEPPAPEPPRFGEIPDERFEIDRGFDPEWSAPVRPSPAAAPVLRAAAPPPEPEPEPVFAEETMTADVAALFDAPPVDAEPIPLAAPPAAPEPAADDAIVLTEVAGTSDLFDDPSLEIAQLAPGEAREIVVPVQLGEGAAVRRFALSIRLRLEPVEPQE
jgi:hypothetical protein